MVKLSHVDPFAGVSYAVVSAPVVVGPANDVGGPFDDGIRTERTRSITRTAALSTLDVLTMDNWATYAALMST